MSASAMILTLLRNTTTCDLQSICHALAPAAPPTVRRALYDLVREGKVCRPDRATYCLPQNHPSRRVITPVVANGAFIQPIPIHRLMAGRA